MRFENVLFKKEIEKHGKKHSKLHYGNKKSKGLGCLLSNALFNVVSSMALHLNVRFEKKLGMLTHFHSAKNTA